MFNRILFVCIGNICRSPMAEFTLKSRLSKARLTQMEISSAGLAAVVDAPLEPNARLILTGNNIPCPQHKGTQLTRQHIQQADLILAMERPHVNNILEIAPESRGRVLLLGHWNNNEEVEDPYGQSAEAFQKAYDKISRHVDSWVNRLQ